MLLGGSLGDRYGRKRVFLLGLAGFTAASMVCGLAPNIYFLIFFVLGYFSYQALSTEPSRLWMVLRSASDSLLLCLVYGLILVALKDREILQLLARFKRKRA